MSRKVSGSRWLTFALLGGLLLVSGHTSFLVSDDRTDFTYRASVEEVRLTFLSWDASGRAIRDLKPSDFVVVDDGVIVRNFRSFGHTEDLPLHVVILVDGSQSVAGIFQRETDDVIQVVNQASWITDDNTSVILFGSVSPTIICAEHCRSQMAWTKLLDVAPGPTTPLFDAVVLAAGLVGRRRDQDSRLAIILFSDGADTISLKSMADAINAVLAADAQVFAFDLNPPESKSRGNKILRAITAETGGNYFPPGRNAVNTLTNLPEYLRTGYTVVYHPPMRTPGFHTVRIQPSRNPGLQFSCRAGYYYKKPIADQRGMP